MAIKNIFKKKQWKADYEAGRDAHGAGQFKAAETHLRAALAKSLELDDSSYGDTALLLGQVLRRLERYDESLELTEKAFQFYHGLYGSGDPRSVAAHLSLVLADPLRAHADVALRQATYVKAVEQFGSKSWQVVRTAALALPSLGSSEREKALGQAQDAMAYALGEGRKELGAWPPVAEEFALELSRLGYSDLAARFMAHQLRVHEERHGEKSEPAALTRLTLGELFLRCGEWRKAETALGKALEQLKLKHGPKSELAKRGTVALGQALARQGRLAQAAPYLTESLESLRADQKDERLEALVGLLEYRCMVAASDAERGALWRELEMVWENDPSEATRSRIFAGFCSAQKRLQQAWELAAAERFLQAVLNRVRQWRGPHHPDVALCMMALASCAGWREDDAKAMSYAEQSLALDEGLDNLIRSVELFGELGDSERAQQSVRLALRLLRSEELGLELGRRQARLARALLTCGEVEGAREQALAAWELLPESETDSLALLLGEAAVMQGDWAQAEEHYRQALPRVTEPVERARGYLHLAWLLCLSGRFSEMQEALREVHELAHLRRDHPLLMSAKALASQGAFYSGSIFEGKEERDAVFDYLRRGQHQQTRRALAILTLLDPFGPEEYSTELDVGTQILAASRYPEASCAVFPSRDVACLGLRHLTRALFFHGQEALAQERLSQYKARFDRAYSGFTNPWASNIHLCAASLAPNPVAKVEALEAAARGLRQLAERHVSLFPTLSVLAELYIELGAVEKARHTIGEALAQRKSGRLKDWMATLERGQLPQLSDPAVRETGSGDGADLASLSPAQEATPAPVTLPADYQEPPCTEHETPEAASPPPLHGLEMVAGGDSGTVVAYGGAAEISRIPLALQLQQRDQAPDTSEVEGFLEEVRARFGNDPRARRDGLVFLALLYPDGVELSGQLWQQALSEVPTEDFETLMQLEQKARESNSQGLVVATLQRRLQEETGRYGEQATESIETLTRLARALEARGELEAATQRIMMTAEILRSWFGPRSRRLLEPLAQLIRLSEKQGRLDAALEHQLERHRVLEAGQSSPEELFSSQVALLPMRGRLGHAQELVKEAQQAQQQLPHLSSVAASELASALLVAAQRLESWHWRVVEAVRLLEIALSAVPEGEVSTQCRIQVALSECQARRDYRSQAEGLRGKTWERISALESEARAEILHEMAESCLRVRELTAAREVAERLLEERIAVGGRKDQWAGRSLLVLAEADLASYRLEGTETAIAMSRPSLEGSPYWVKAQMLKAQADLFLGREDLAAQALDSLPEEEAWELAWPLAVWRGEAARLVAQLTQEPASRIGQVFARLEVEPLETAVRLLEFLARAGQSRLLQQGMERLEPRCVALLPTDVRAARLAWLRAVILVGERRWAEAESLLHRVLDVVPSDRVELPEGLTVMAVRGLLVRCLLAQDKVTQAEAQARMGSSEAAEVLGEEDLRTVAFRSHQAACLAARGEHESALELLDEVLDPLQERLGETHLLLRDLYRGMAQTFAAQGDLDSARLSAEEALRQDKECRGLSWHLIEDLQLLAAIERRVDPPEAIHLLQTALELAAQVFAPEHPYLALLHHELEALEELEEPQAHAEPDEESDDDEELEPSLDGWEVVEDSVDELPRVESEAPPSDPDDELEESADLLFAPLEEEDVEDSAFDLPVVPLETEPAEEWELTPEELAEEAALAAEDAARERAAEELVAEEPVVEEPTAEVLAIEEPAIEEPTAEELAIEEPVVEEPAAEELAIEEPAIEEPVVEESTAEELAIEEPVVEEPTAEEPAIEEPTAEEPAIEEPVVEEPTAEESAIEEPVVEEPAAEELAIEEPVVEEPAAEKLAIEEPTAEEPAIEEPAVEEPTAEEPTAEEPAIEEPVVEESAAEDSAAFVLPVSALPSYEAFLAFSEGPRSTSASVGLDFDFPSVPFRVPELTEVTETSELGEPWDYLLRWQDPESCWLPLAPIFFLPFPWGHAVEASIEGEFAELYQRFQDSFARQGDWRALLDEAVSLARLQPTPAAGTFLFLLGSQLESAGRLHTADLCLATAIELLESGTPLSAACHLAGRVAGRRGELRRALDYLERAAEMAEELELAILKIDAAECHLCLGRPEEALLGLEEVFEYLQQEAPDVQALAVQARMAQVHLLIGDPDSCQTLVEQALELLPSESEDTHAELARLLLARALARLGQQETARSLAEQAWRTTTTWTGEQREVRRMTTSVWADTLMENGREAEAWERLSETGLVGAGLAESELLVRAGHLACRTGRLDAAHAYLRMGRSLLERFQSPASWRSAFLELEAELCLASGEPTRAEAVCAEALTLFEQEATGPVDRSRHLVRAARAAAAAGHRARALSWLEEAHGLRDLHLGATHPHTVMLQTLLSSLCPSPST